MSTNLNQIRVGTTRPLRQLGEHPRQVLKKYEEWSWKIVTVLSKGSYYFYDGQSFLGSGEKDF